MNNCDFKISTCDTPATSVTTAGLSAKIRSSNDWVDADLRFARTDLKGGPWA